MKRFGSFALDTSNLCLWHEGAQIALPLKPFAVLRYLVENPGRLITHDELLDALWPGIYVQPQVLRTYMLELRKLLGDDPAQPKFIQTLPKRGYCFLAPVIDSAGTVLSMRAGAAQPGAKTAAIVGRDDELASLNVRLESLANGRRQIVFVTGETGIGKTALVDAFCQQIEQSPAVTIARGQCIEGFARKEEYYPVVEALGRLCASADGERACRILSRMAPRWMTFGGAGMEAANATTIPQPTHDRMPGDLCAALEEFSEEKPLVLIFEDLHWADDSTLHLISALARRRAATRLMVLATFLPQEGGPDRLLKRLKQDLLLRRLCAEIALEPLRKAAVVALLSRELRQETLPPGLASFIHQHSEGNPLFAMAILEHLIGQGFLARKPAESRAESKDQLDQWQLCAPFQEMEASVPDGLAQMIEVEIERLSQQEARLLEAGSLIRVAFPAWAVAAALGEDPTETEEACDNLARRLYFLERAGEDELPDGTTSAFYVFAHELYREVLYRRQAAARRAKRHVRIAERLEELFAGREADVARELAMHYEAAGDWRRAVKALREAVSRAIPRQAYAESFELLEQALRIAAALREHEPAREDAEDKQAILSGLLAARAALLEKTNQHTTLPEKV